MNKNEKKPKKKFSIKRKTVFMTLYLVILPVFVIAALYISTYLNNRINPFSDEKSTYDVVTMKGKDFDKFSFEFECVSYHAPSTPTSVQFKGAAFDEKVSGTLTTISMQVILGSKWIGYTSNVSTTGTITYNTSAETKDDLSSSDYKTVTISSMTQKYPKTKLLFVTVKSPTAYVYLSFTTSKSEEFHYILTYSYSEYFVNTALGGL